MKSWRISSIRTHRRAVLALIGALCLLSAVLSLCMGAAALSPGEVLAALTGRGEDPVAWRIVYYSRLPRTCGCLLAGLALAVSGTVIQGVLNNPLAAPNIIGVTSGAGLAVALWGAAVPTAVAGIPVAAFLGAMGGVTLVVSIARRTGASRLTLALAGVAVSGMFNAAVDAVITLIPDALIGYTDFRIGSLANLSMAQLRPALWVILIAFPLVLSLAGEIDVLLLGGETAQSLGVRIKPLRLILLLLASALAGAAVSFAGLLGFIGLIVPHIMRRLVGEESLPLLAASAMGGAALLTLCDTLARTLFAPHELPVGIVLSLLGGPFFIWLLLRQRGGRIHD